MIRLAILANQRLLKIEPYNCEARQIQRICQNKDEPSLRMPVKFIPNF